MPSPAGLADLRRQGLRDPLTRLPGGSLESVTFGICEEELTAAHLRDLAESAQYLAPR